MKVLITGSSGRIGSSIASHLRYKHQIIGGDIKPGPFTTHYFDITDKASVFKLAGEVDAIIHVAALHAPHVLHSSEEQFQRINVHGTMHLLEACIKYRLTRLVYTSTTSLYGNAMVAPERAVWVAEDLVPQPRDVYDRTKLTAETLCKEASGSSLSCISLRMSRCFPEDERLMTLYRLYRGVDVRDVAHGHELALNSPLKGYEVFNISAATPFTQDDLAHLYSKANETILRYHPWAQKAFEQKGWSFPSGIDRVYVIEKAKKLLGYKPSYNFENMF